ncbi:MAG: methyltransferase domain-containing protein [Acidobacteriota bacterium]|nr:methyltransferase domain-containing protein [Acidobacteriota bacterium]
MTTLLLLFCLIPSPALRVTPVNPLSQQSASTSTAPQTGQGGQPDVARRVVKQRRPRIRQRPLRKPDVIYYPTPDETVTEMLRLADIKQGDVLYDLGSGDGRIPIVAAQQYGIRAVGIEIDPKMVMVAEERAQQASVEGLVSFRNADMFRSNISEATVVTLYLSNKINLLLRPKLLGELRPGSRILSHDFHMGDWKPECKIRVPWQKGLFRTIYFWRVPARRSRVGTEER